MNNTTDSNKKVLLQQLQKKRERFEEAQLLDVATI